MNLAKETALSIALLDQHYILRNELESLFEAIEEKRKIGFARLLFALGIRHVGEQAGKLFANYYLSWEGFVSAVRAAEDEGGAAWAELLSIDGVGEVIKEHFGIEE